MKRLVSYTYLFQPSELVAFTVENLNSGELFSGIVEGILAFEEDWWLVNAWRKNGQVFEVIVCQNAFLYWQLELAKLGYQITPITLIPTGEFGTIQITKLKSEEYLWVEYHDTFEGLEFLDFDLELALKS